MIESIRNEYINIAEDGDLKLVGQQGLYTTTTGETIDVICNVKLLNTVTQEVLYKDNNWIAWDSKNFISLSQYADKILFYWNTCKDDDFWKVKFLNKFFIAKHTHYLEAYCSRVERQLEEDRAHAEIKMKKDIAMVKLNELKNQIELLGYKVIFNNIYFLVLSKNEYTTKANDENILKLYNDYLMNRLKDARWIEVVQNGIYKGYDVSYYVDATNAVRDLKDAFNIE